LVGLSPDSACNVAYKNQSGLTHPVPPTPPPGTLQIQYAQLPALRTSL
jgi:hypothetical protein